MAAKPDKQELALLSAIDAEYTRHPPADLVTALITEKGVVREPNRQRIAELFSA